MSNAHSTLVYRHVDKRPDDPFHMLDVVRPIFTSWASKRPEVGQPGLDVLKPRDFLGQIDFTERDSPVFDELESDV